MSVAKVIEISSVSKKSFEDAIGNGVQRASETVKHIKSGWVNEMKIQVEDGKVTEYQVNLKLTFLIS